MKITSFILLYIYTLLIISLVKIESSKDVKQTGEIDKSKTRIGVDCCAYWSGIGSTWKGMKGQTNGGCGSGIRRCCGNGNIDTRWSKSGGRQSSGIGGNGGKGGYVGGGGRKGGIGGNGGGGGYNTPIPIPIGGKGGSGGKS